MKYFRLALLILLFLVGCTDLPQSGQFQADCTYTLSEDNSVVLNCKPLTPLPVTVLPTNTPIPSPTEAPSPTPVPPTPSPSPTTAPSPTVTASPTMLPTPVSGTNLFRDPGFEGPYASRLNSDGYYHIVPLYWHPFYCDGCPAYRQGTGNPEGLLLGRPEYKPAAADADVLRIHSGTNAGEFFGFYRALEGGYYQIVSTPVGATCTVSVYVQSWSGFDGDSDPHESHLITQDDKDNSTWYILIDRLGGTNAFAGGMLKSRGFGYNDGIYDRWARIDYTFVTTGPKTTVFIDNVRLWPVRNNNNYVDDASIVCSGSLPTTTPTGVPTSSGTILHNADEYYRYTAVPPTGTYHAVGDVIKFFCIKDDNGTYYGAESDCDSATVWSLIRTPQTVYAVPLEESNP